MSATKKRASKTIRAAKPSTHAPGLKATLVDPLQVRVALMSWFSPRPMAFRRRSSRLLGVSEATLDEWVRDVIGVIPVQTPPRLVHGYEQQVARARIQERLVDAINALSDGAEVESRDPRQRAMNILQGVLYALNRNEGHAAEALSHLEKIAVDYVDKLPDDPEGTQLPGTRVLVPRDYRHLKKRANQLFGAKVAFLETVQRSLARHVGPNRQVPGRRLQQKRLDAVIAAGRAGDTLDLANPMNAEAFKVADDIVEFVVKTGALDAILRGPNLKDVVRVTFVLRDLLDSGLATPEQVGRACLYALGVAWKDTKNLLIEAAGAPTTPNPRRRP